jgi:hydrogenase maturation protein HypF
VLRAWPADFERLGHLRPIPMPGGDRAAVECVRPAASLLREAFGEGWPARPAAARLRERAGADLEALEAQLASGLNCPRASSLGRLFDAAAALAGVAFANRYEAEAPMRLEGVADSLPDAAGAGEYPFAITAAEPFEIDWRPLAAALAADAEAGADPAAVAARFHNTLAAMLTAAAVAARERTGLSTVAISGGCMANRLLRRELRRRLAADGFEVLLHRAVPCNDGGIALGQAFVAAARLCRL